MQGGAGRRYAGRGRGGVLPPGVDTPPGGSGRLRFRLRPLTSVSEIGPHGGRRPRYSAAQGAGHVVSLYFLFPLAALIGLVMECRGGADQHNPRRPDWLPTRPARPASGHPDHILTAARPARPATVTDRRLSAAGP